MRPVSVAPCPVPPCRQVRNHIGGIHACGIALAAESATGIVIGMNVPDTRMPLCKSMAIDFKKVAKGAVNELSWRKRNPFRDNCLHRLQKNREVAAFFFFSYLDSKIKKPPNNIFSIENRGIATPFSLADRAERPLQHFCLESQGREVATAFERSPSHFGFTIESKGFVTHGLGRGGALSPLVGKGLKKPNSSTVFAHILDLKNRVPFRAEGDKTVKRNGPLFFNSKKQRVNHERVVFYAWIGMPLWLWPSSSLLHPIFF